MTNSKKRNLFPGSNTSQGFYSLFNYIISREDANKIICLKGGPGTGKSSFMNRVANHFSDLGYSIEYDHCSSDDQSFDAVIINELKVVLIDATPPHVVEPTNFGVIDEILNLGVGLDTNKLAKYRNEIVTISKEMKESYASAYRFFGAAKCIHEDWSNVNNKALNLNKVSKLIYELKSKILQNSICDIGKDRHMFSTAFTPNGIVSYSKELSSEVDNLYVLKGGPGLNKSDILKSVGNEAQNQGLFVEYLHDPFIPQRIENIIIPQLSTGIFTTNEISRLSFNGTEYDMSDFCNSAILSKKSDQIAYDKNEFYTLLNKGLSYIKEAHNIHDKLEAYYIDAMNFDKTNSLYEETIKKIEQYM